MQAAPPTGPPLPQADPRHVDAPSFRRALAAAQTGDVRFDDVSRALYSTDASVYEIRPLGVVLPRTREDLVAIVRLCHQFRCPLTMRGGGTSQAGQAIGPGLIVDVSRHLNRLLEVNPQERWARVEPGLVLDELNAALRPHQLRFAPDISTASRATIGGMMANNSAGARSILYGITLHHVLEQHVVLSDGSVGHFRDLSASELDDACRGSTLEARGYATVRTLAAACRDEIERRYPRLLRRVSGYNLDEFARRDRPFNLARLMVGSEGTLGVVAEAKLRLVPLPAAKAVLAIEFSTLMEALRATPVVLEHRPSAVEVMDKFVLDHARHSPALDRQRRALLQGDPGALLCVEFYGDDRGELPGRLADLQTSLSRQGLGARYLHALDAGTQARIWGLREACLGLSMAMKDDGKSLSFVEDTAVAPDRLAAFIDRFLAVVGRHHTVAGVYAHASVGCLHVRPVVNMKTADGVRIFEAIAAEIADLVLEFGGALSGEHGDGLVRSPFLRKMFGPVLYEAFREIKRTFDPRGILNPGKIVDPPPLTANLRYGPAYRAAAPATHFDYTEWNGMSGAVEMCSGLGVCRKTLDGTMCPSYMATREEAHSTRGRANVLRLVMAGRLPEAGLGDDGVRETLDLCLECRACKAECPVGVDVARFKSEFLADYFSRHGTPLRARALGRVHELSAWASRWPSLANALRNASPIRMAAEHLLGLDRRRPLPGWAPQSLAARWKTRRMRAPGAPVVLFNDTFTNFYHPEVGLAAADVLEAAGMAVDLGPGSCCGRPLVSQGLLAAARTRAAETTARLFPLASAGRTIVVLEPSCLSALREDAPALLRGAEQARARRVGDACVLFEEFLEAAVQSGRAHLDLEPGPSRILVHAHCHQRSMGLAAPAVALLRRIPGSTVVDLDAGCCGMAGSFGYTRDHFDISRQIGERRLLPAARALGADEMLVASGVSCRQQVRDFAGAPAVHAAEAIRARLPRAPA